MQGVRHPCSMRAGLFLLSIWSMRFVWLNKTNQMKHMNQINLSRPSRSTIRRACRSYADGFHLLLNLEREKWIIPCQDTDLVDFIQMIR